MKHILLTAALLAACVTALAKLPPPPPLDDAAKAKAAETAARTAWQAKIDGYQLCRAQDRVVAHMGKASGKAGAKPAMTQVPTMAAKPASAAASGTPVATVGTATPPPAPCLDPGPFAFNPPEQKPLETSGAHSPTGTAASPPSVGKTSSEMTPGGKKKP